MLSCTDSQHNFVRKKKYIRTAWNPRWIPRKSHDYIHHLQLSLYSTNSVIYDLQWYYHVRGILLWLTATEWLTAEQCYVSNRPPHHPIAVLKRAWSLWQVLSPWYEANMVHVRLLFLQPSLCDVHSCSLLLVGAFDELQHFIWSLKWIEWGNFSVRHRESSSLDQAYLSCIKPERVCYKSHMVA